MKRENLNPSNCRINMITVLRVLYNVNLLLISVLVLLATFKSANLLMKQTSWEQLLAPLYFFMTELLLIAIVSFVVLVNSVIQLCCNQSSRASRHSRAHNDANSQESKDSDKLSITNPSALVRVSVWFLYVSVCGLLCLFLLLKNASTLKQRDTSNTKQSPAADQ